ncbi:hypothetical protein ABBQ38_015244 [Trebouxia sp. C0009 RCD-2024]
MPALVVANVRWHISSDDVPLFAAFGSTFHAIWILVILLTSQGVLNMPNKCHHEGRQYIATVTGLLFCFTFGFVVEVLLIWEGCKGAPFELSKRRKMTLFLLCRLANVIQETLITAYGTYVVFGTHPKCKVEEEIIWDPRREVKVLVCLTWGFQLLVLLNTLLWYNAWPEKQATLVWENRFAWIGKWLLCIRNPDTIETRQTSLRRIARWVTQLVGHVDLTPSDIVLALILTATLQRRRRREHIMQSLHKPDKGSSRAVAPPRQAISLASADSAPLPVGFQFSSSPSTSAMFAGPPLHLLERELSDSQEIVLNIEPQEYLCRTVVTIIPVSQLADFQKPDRSKRHHQQTDHQTPAYSSPFAQQPYTEEDSSGQSGQDLTQPLLGGPSQLPSTAPGTSDVKLSVIPEHAQTNEDASTGPVASRQSIEQKDSGHSLGGGDPLTKLKRQMSLTTKGCITPSGMEEQLRGLMTPEQAVQRYTGQHWRVPASLLSHMSHFAKYAAAVYGLEPHSHKESRFTNALMAWLRKSQEQAKQGTLSGGGQGDLYEQLNYEAIKEEAGMDDSQLVYVSFSNQALAHLPYMVALDETSRSVVLAVRGTATMEDVITDSVAAPDLLDRSEWLPESFKQQQAQTGERMYAHGGIVAAAAAILADMEQHNLLQRLLEEYDPLDQQHQQPSHRNQEDGDNLPSWDQTIDYRSWKLVITGHSLGAGVAALMTLRLKDKYPSAKCWAFCPPGGLMSANLSHAAQGFVNCVVVGKDIVPRLSVVNIGRLIDELVTSLAMCKHNKNNMLLRKLSTYWRHHHVEQLFHDHAHIPKEALQVLDQYNQGIEARNRMLELILPGKVVFLRPRKTNNVRTSWDAVWMAPEEIAKEGIMISPHLLDDHYTATLEAALRGAQFHGGPFDENHGAYFPPVHETFLDEASSPFNFVV